MIFTWLYQLFPWIDVFENQRDHVERPSASRPSGIIILTTISMTATIHAILLVSACQSHLSTRPVKAYSSWKVENLSASHNYQHLNMKVIKLHHAWQYILVSRVLSQSQYTISIFDPLRTVRILTTGTIPNQYERPRNTQSFQHTDGVDARGPRNPTASLFEEKSSHPFARLSTFNLSITRSIHLNHQVNDNDI